MNPIVDTLCNTNMSTFVEALQQRDLTLIRMADGTPPTQEQIDLLMQVGAAELEAARVEMERRAMQAQNATFPPDRIEQLMRKYDAQPGEPLGQVRSRMSVEDQQEVAEMVRLMQIDSERVPL